MSDNELDPIDVTQEDRLAERVARTLRVDVPVRAEWRAGLLRGIATLPVHGTANAPVSSSEGRRWELRPLTAVAAALLCAALGAGLAYLFVPSFGASAKAPIAALPDGAARGEASAANAVRFVLVAPYASRVSLVGDFNKWNPKAMPMRRSPDGRTWTVDVPLAPGRHVYSFFVDGDLAPDPAAPRAGDDDFGVPSSVILVTGGRT